MERNNSRIGSIVAEDGYDDLSEALIETTKTDTIDPVDWT